VAEAAVKSGVARISVDLEHYRENLEKRLRKMEKKIKGHLTETG
jgi:hypothetical protein